MFVSFACMGNMSEDNRERWRPELVNYIFSAVDYIARNQHKDQCPCTFSEDQEF